MWEGGREHLLLKLLLLAAVPVEDGVAREVDALLRQDSVDLPPVHDEELGLQVVDNEGVPQLGVLDRLLQGEALGMVDTGQTLYVDS